MFKYRIFVWYVLADKRTRVRLSISLFFERRQGPCARETIWILNWNSRPVRPSFFSHYSSAKPLLYFERVWLTRGNNETPGLWGGPYHFSDNSYYPLGLLL